MAAIESNSEVIPIFVLAVLTGLYIATFLHCIRWLVFNDDELTLRKRFSRLMLIATCLIFTLTIANLVLSILIPLALLRNEMQLFMVFLVSSVCAPFLSPPLIEFQFSLLKAPIEALTSILADVILIYRCWVVYNRNWRVICFPIFMLLAYTCFAVVFNYYSVTILVYSEVTMGSIKVYRAGIVAAYTCTIVLNIYTTSSIILRIWKVAKESLGRHTRRGLHFTIHVIADSGLLYTLSSIIGIITWLYTLKNTGAAAQLIAAIFSSINYAMVGIAFNLILIRVASQRASSDSTIDSAKTIPEMYRYEVFDRNRKLFLVLLVLGAEN
ncbi:hypothetical protein AMATHDRAFT_42804 [Amanita thiersii Skay4041]|uniref:G-protein coupled receptors family 1 profile domain-containing protein n=1 Tax=Amanita thiersii Skay4041 TaxID=703135 RepID=A0A2A9NC45_9AGAR|nr:hypothetical protein AMATHDRAFT_42804 [Amanita thiersii Skay4041]